MLPAIHGLLAGGWIGTVLVEALFERALLGQGRDNELLLARLHWRVDLLVELPLLVLVAVTGVILLSSRQIAGILVWKLGFATIAMAANLYCICLVKRRLAHAAAGEWAAFAAADHRQHQFGAVVFVGLLGAAGIGIFTS